MKNNQKSSLKLRQLFLGAIAAALPLSTTPLPAKASVFQNSLRWDTSLDGYTYVPVCIDSRSSTAQRGDGALYGLIHYPDPAPGLGEVIGRVRGALNNSWEKWSSVRFIGWQACNSLTAEQRKEYISLLVAPDAENFTSYGNPLTSLGTKRHVQFAAWGKNFNRCISYNWGHFRVEYSFACAEQYAIHEFGHALGFQHEWQHPKKPATCIYAPTNEGIVTSYATTYTYPKQADYTIVRPNDYDWDSIMVYHPGCVEQTGVRFGSENLSSIDIQGVSAVYPSGKPELTALANVANATNEENNRADYCQIDGQGANKKISCRIFSHYGFTNQKFESIKGIDAGYTDLPRAFVDVNGDKKADYCRVVGDGSNKFLACNLAGSNGFGTDQYQFKSITGIDLGDAKFPRGFADVNGDKKADFCRVVGSRTSKTIPPASGRPVLRDRFLACNLAEANGFGVDQYQFKSIPNIDPGYANFPKGFADVNGDGKADFCRTVGYGTLDRMSLACNLAEANGFGADQYQFKSPQGIAFGDPSLPQGFVDVNGDGKADFCRTDRYFGSSSYLIGCNLAEANGFGSDLPFRFQYQSVVGIDLGYPNLLRSFADVNLDGKADFCRVVGAIQNQTMRCNLAENNGFSQNQYGF
ncbi:MAG: hypothetical protein KME17_29820 [Cyanosarcina radialis HA8281-LM2]|nr:hypothetical protein [Cyanosarcina radialis HA8281-LM2]